MKASDRRPVADGRLRLTALGLGGAALAGMYAPVSAEEAAATLAAAWDAGLRYIDSAPYYGYTLGEHRAGAFLREQARGDFVIGTKVGRLMRPDASVTPGSDGWARPLPFRPVFDYRRDAILRSVEDSLQRLGLDRVDMLLVHDIGRATHGAAHDLHWAALTRGGGFRALEDLRREGVVSAIGLGVNEWEVMRDAMQECDLDCSLLAGRYTLLEQRSLAFLDECVRRRHAIVVGGAFNSGLLAGQAKFDYQDAPPELLRRAADLRAACAEYGVPLEAAALQFPLGHRAVVSVVSGMRSPAQVHQNLGWFEQPIPAGLWTTLRERGLLDAAAPCPHERMVTP
jgi:D-threo-aldose 1-dehydrogenase